jgi:hypothetical protein
VLAFAGGYETVHSLQFTVYSSRCSRARIRGGR